MAKSSPDERQQKIDYLISQRDAGKVSAPAEAHAALKQKFGGSLPFGVVGTILGGGVPGKTTGKKKGKTGRKPGRPPGRGSTGRKPGRAGGGQYAILTGDGELEMAANRAEMVQSVKDRLHRGQSAEDLVVYQRIPLKVSTRYDVELQ